MYILENIAINGFKRDPKLIHNNLFLGTRVVESRKSAAPAFSFGSRHSFNNKTYGPGPANYDVSGLAAKGKDTPPQISLQSRAKPPKIIETPAPGKKKI